MGYDLHITRKEFWADEDGQAFHSRMAAVCDFGWRDISGTSRMRT